MAHTDLFKPYQDSRLGQLFFKKDMPDGYIIEIAHSECQAVYPNLRLDFVLSVGCGRTKHRPSTSMTNHDTKQHQGKDDENHSIFSQDSWDKFAHYPRPNSILDINPIVDELPELDDVASISKLQKLIQEKIDPADVTKLVAQLFATLFYAETDDSVEDTAAGEELVPSVYKPLAYI